MFDLGSLASLGAMPFSGGNAGGGLLGALMQRQPLPANAGPIPKFGPNGGGWDGTQWVNNTSPVPFAGPSATPPTPVNQAPAINGWMLPNQTFGGPQQSTMPMQPNPYMNGWWNRAFQQPFQPNMGGGMWSGGGQVPQVIGGTLGQPSNGSPWQPTMQPNQNALMGGLNMLGSLGGGFGGLASGLAGLF